MRNRGKKEDGKEERNEVRWGGIKPERFYREHCGARWKLQQSSNTTGTMQCCQRGTEKCGSVYLSDHINTHKKKNHTKRLIKTRWMDHTYWFADPKVFPENPKNIKNKYMINLVIVTASGKKRLMEVSLHSVSHVICVPMCWKWVSGQSYVQYAYCV